LIEAAKDADVNAVKFQTFRAEHFVSISALKAEYQKNYTIESESQLEMLKKLELDVNSHRMLIEYCRKKNIEFLSSPFDLESVDLLYELGLETFKIPSGEITNLPYLRKIGKLKKKIILSTGMANLEEIENALNVLVNTGTPKEIITVLHCNTEYPTALEDVNLLAMLTMKTELDVEVGYSDHTLGIEIPIAAVALGASVIEKHFTLDKNMEGPDHKASLDPDELKQMVRAIRLIEKAMGDGIKKSSQSEQKNKPVVRKSIVAVKDISKGEVFTEENITTKRPGIGISPMMWDEVIGQRANKDYKQDDLI
jgi:N,N'-diacetyllegionaminate synthase